MIGAAGTDPTADLASEFALPVREGASKLMTLGEAVAQFVTPGSTVHVAYADARPNAALLELARRFHGTDPQLTLVTAGLVSSQHSLVELGLVRRLVTSFAGENYPVARPNRAFQRAVASGRVNVENWSLWSLTARLVAGALGVPFFPVRSLAGSSLAEEHDGGDFVEIDDPIGGTDRVGLVSALRPDVVLLQGVAADPHGNVVAPAPYGEGHWGALAARVGVIACVERVVDTDVIRQHGALVRIPAHTVVAVCETPYGSHPYGLYNPGLPGVASYGLDEEFVAEVYRAGRDEKSFRAWIDEWVLGTPDHNAYLTKLGDERLARLLDGVRDGSWTGNTRVVDAGDNDDWNDNEMLVVAAARRLEDVVVAGAFDAVLAGVGLANLAAWLGVTRLKRLGESVELMAEIGMFGYTPRPGEPFIFSPHNIPTCKLLGDVMGVLGTFVSGPRTRALGVIGAGQIDGEGNANSTLTEQGEFLVGSGGANDIASSSEEVLVVIHHARKRLAASLPYVTSPGHNVGTIVTSAGVFVRRDGRFHLTRYLPTAGSDPRAAVEFIRAGCEWDFEVAQDLAAEMEPSHEELRLLRAFDPDGTFVWSGSRPVSTPSIDAAT